MSTIHQIEPSVMPIEKHYRIAEVAERLGIGTTAATKLFQHEPGVCVLATPKPGVRLKRTYLIPESVIVRVTKRMQITQSA